MEQAQPRVAQLIQSGEDLLEKGNEVSAQSLQQNLDNLKSRWDLVTNRATEKKARLEQALTQVLMNISLKQQNVYCMSEYYSTNRFFQR